MKKLLFLLFILPVFCFAQTTVPVIPQWKQHKPLDSLLLYSVPGVAGSKALPDTAWVRKHGVPFTYLDTVTMTGDGSFANPFAVRLDSPATGTNLFALFRRSDGYIVQTNINFNKTTNKVLFNGIGPQTNVAPTVGNDLVNLTYFNANAGAGSFLPKVFPSSQTVTGNGHPLAFNMTRQNGGAYLSLDSLNGMIMQGFDKTGNYGGQIILDSGQFAIGYTRNDVNHTGYSVGAANDQMRVARGIFTGGIPLVQGFNWGNARFNSTGVEVQDEIDSVGLKYTSNASYKYGGLDTLWIPNLGYIQRHFGTGSGTVTAVSIASANGFTGTSSGGATPALTLTLQNATTSQSGQLTSTDWNTFNNKQTALVSGTNIKTINGGSILGSGDISTLPTAGTGLSYSGSTLNVNSQFFQVTQGYFVNQTTHTLHLLTYTDATKLTTYSDVTVLAGQAVKTGLFNNTQVAEVKNTGSGFTGDLYTSSDFGKTATIFGTSGTSIFTGFTFSMASNVYWIVTNNGVSPVLPALLPTTLNTSSTTDNLIEGATNKYYTDARAIAAPLTGYTRGAGTPSASDNIIQAMQKIDGNEAADATNIAANTTAIAGKQASGNYITGITGDATASGPGSVALTLTTVNSNVGSFGDASHSLNITSDAKGRITGLSTNQIFITEPQVSSLVSDLANLQYPIKINTATVYNAFGDSFTNSNGATVFANGYMPLFSTYLNIAYNNYALSGSGVWNAAKAAYANENPGNLPTFSSLMIGFNDLRRGGASNYTHQKLLNGHTAIFVNHFIDTVTYFGSGSSRIVQTTPSGSWSNNYNAASVGGKSPANGASIAINGATITATTYGNNIIIGCIGSDGTLYTYGTFTVSIDGVSQGSFNENKQTDGISDGVNDNGRATYPLIFSGLSEGKHTVVITTTSSNQTVFDYIGHLKQPANATPLLVMETARMNSTGYAIAPANSSTLIVDAWNASLDSLVTTWPKGYPVYVGKTNTYYSIVNGVSTDNIHPNDLGHRQIYNAAYQAVFSLGSALINQQVNTTSSPNFNAITATNNVGGSSLSAGANFQAKLNPTVSAAAVSAGLNGTFPYLSFYNTSAGTNQKWADWYEDNTGNIIHRVVADNGSSTQSVYKEVRNGVGVSSINYATAITIDNGVLTAPATSSMFNVYDNTNSHGSMPINTLTLGQWNAIASKATGLQAYINGSQKPVWYDSGGNTRVTLDSARADGRYALQSTTVAGFALSGNITLGTLTPGSTLKNTTGSNYNGSAGTTIDIDLTHANTWSGVQTISANWTVGADQTYTLGSANFNFASIFSANYKSGSNLIFDAHNAAGNIFFQINGTNEAKMFTNGHIAFGNSLVDNGNLSVAGSIYSTSNLIAATQTTVSGSSGNAIFSQPEQGAAYKEVLIYCNGLVGAVSYTYPTAFVNTPVIVTDNGPSSGVVTSISNVGVTITGTTTTGFIILKGY